MNTLRNFLKIFLLFGIVLGCCTVFAQDQSAEESKLFHVPMKHVLKPSAPPRKIDIPDVGGFKVLKGDFHIHTLFSDGRVMPVDRVIDAVDNGLDVIAITDHIEVMNARGGISSFKLAERNNDANHPYDIAKPEADKRKLLLVRGGEVTKSTMPPGHFNVLFVQDVNPIAEVKDDWRKMLEVAAGQGAFIQWNHPGWVAPKWGGIAEGQPMVFSPEHEEVRQKGWLHGIEVFNGSERYPIVSDWCNEKDLTITSNSDIHGSEANTYGFQNPLRPMNLILAKERTVESVKEAFFAKRVIAWAAGNLWGRNESLEPLFDACIAVGVASGKVTLTNRSDIPCTISYTGKTYDLVAKGTAEFALDPNQKMFSVTNWFPAANKPLERKIP